MTAEEQSSRLGTPRPAIDPAVRDAVNACTDRGPVLPISLQDDCGCLGKELSECRAGKGAIAGRVTLRDCLACQSQSVRREAPGGFEPPMEVLQTSALPLGYGART